MATQRLMVATLAGQSAVAVSGLFEKWRAVVDPEAVDRLCLSIRENALSLSVVYFAEWVDRWLMGDLAPGPGAVEGERLLIGAGRAETGGGGTGSGWRGCGVQGTGTRWITPARAARQC